MDFPTKKRCSQRIRKQRRKNRLQGNTGSNPSDPIAGIGKRGKVYFLIPTTQPLAVICFIYEKGALQYIITLSASGAAAFVVRVCFRLLAAVPLPLRCTVHGGGNCPDSEQPRTRVRPGFRVCLDTRCALFVCLFLSLSLVLSPVCFNGESGRS